MTDPDISMKNTKAEILEALQSAREQAERAERRLLNPQKEEKERSNTKALESAKKSAEQNIFSKELIDRFNALQTAIAAEEERLEELYGVGREIQKLATVIEAGRERIAKIDAEKAEKEETAHKSLEKLRADYSQKSAELQAEHEQMTKKLKTERAREDEEYQYHLKRTRERENNLWADEKAARESELQKREVKAAAMLSEAEEKAGYIRSLEEKVEIIPDLITAERESAVAAATENLNREFAHKAALSEMERKNAVGRLEDKVAYLEKELDAAGKTTAVLQTKLDKAYSEIRDLATKTVESAGGVKIIGNEKIGG